MKKLILFVCVLTSTSCSKFLDAKPDARLVVPSTLADLQALLDNSNTMIINDPYADELSSDNFYLSSSTWQGLNDYDRGYYVWQPDNFYFNTSNDWSYLYKKVYYANTVLEQIDKIERIAKNQTEWDNVKGQALMVRGKAFLQAVLLWGPAYDAATASTDMGIPLRLNTHFEEKTMRASVQQSYDQVLADLGAAALLLPNRGAGINRGCKAAAYGYLARACLNIRNFARAGSFADSSLQINSALLNYNTLNSTATYSMPVVAQNPEVNFYTGFSNTALVIGNAKVDTVLYNSYNNNDYRKTILFKQNTDGSIAFKGGYQGSTGHFSGIASDEMYITRAECYARAGNIGAAMTDVNTLLKMRYKTNSFTPLTAATAAEALDIVLKERRKELLFRGVRWMDIKRLNKEGAAITLKRMVNNQVYVLPPNDLRYALGIPDYVIQVSGILQNPR